MRFPKQRSSVVRLGEGIPVPLLSRLAGCEGGMTLIGLPQDVKRGASVGATALSANVPRALS
jgi:hypothetical protein